jgi:hypothetical protein
MAQQSHSRYVAQDYLCAYCRSSSDLPVGIISRCCGCACRDGYGKESASAIMLQQPPVKALCPRGCHRNAQPLPPIISPLHDCARGCVDSASHRPDGLTREDLRGRIGPIGIYLLSFASSAHGRRLRANLLESARARRYLVENWPMELETKDPRIAGPFRVPITTRSLASTNNRSVI